MPTRGPCDCAREGPPAGSTCGRRSGLGAPVWDLAGVVDGLLIPSLVEGRDQALDVTRVARLAEPALIAHRRAAGAEFSPALDELATAVVARLAQTATQLAAMG